jgi:hypothetical protein
MWFLRLRDNFGEKDGANNLGLAYNFNDLRQKY